MRKIEQALQNAIVTKQPVWSTGNTSVTTHGSVTEVRLHGNKIAEVTDQWVRITDAGWRTATTKSRLNAILGCLFDGVTVFQESFEWFVSEQGVATPMGSEFLLQR